MVEQGAKPVWAIKFRNFCFNNDLKAKDIARILNLQTPIVYKYWSGEVGIPDKSKKILERETGLDIYDTFYNEEL